jgi:hypothetical protein
MIRFEWVVAIFVTLVAVLFTGFFLDRISEPYSPFLDTTFSRWVMPLLVLAFGWGTAAVMWFSIATGRDLFK